MKLTRIIKVKNDLGLHTRPATVIVKLLQAYKSSVQFTYKRDTINARSIMSILMLAVRKNTSLTVTVEGDDAEKVLEELVNAFENQFWEKNERS
jgi:phosphocarrier protein HPr